MKKSKAYIHFFPVEDGGVLILFADSEAVAKTAMGVETDDTKFKTFFVENESELSHLVICLTNGEPTRVICSK